MAYMEDVGAYYAIVLHDPRLRSGLIAEAKHSRQSSKQLWGGERLAFGLARALRALAMQIKPRQPHGSETDQRAPVALMHQGGDH